MHELFQDYIEAETEKMESYKEGIADITNKLKTIAAQLGTGISIVSVLLADFLSHLKGGPQLHPKTQHSQLHLHLETHSHFLFFVHACIHA